MIDIIQTDGTRSVHVVNPYDTLPNGTIVYTHPYVNDLSAGTFFVNPVHGVDMNKDGAFAGTPDKIHNGIDDILWTGSALSGTWDFNSAVQKKTGTYSVDATATTNNSEALFTRSSTINLGNYLAVTGHIYITDWSTAGSAKEVELRIRNGGVDVGNTILLRDFLNVGLFNTWQKFTIPIDLLGTGPADIDEMVIKTVDNGGGQAPSYYLDDMQWEETAGSLSYSLPVPPGFEFFLEEISFAAAGPLDSTLANGTTQNIPYDKFVGETLTNGVLLQVQSDEGLFNAAIFTNHIEFMTTPAMEFQSGGDATNTWVRYYTRYKSPPSVSGDKNGKFTVIINDDLSNLLYFRVIARGFLRAIPKPNS